jgi:hypothetical protein
MCYADVKMQTYLSGKMPPYEVYAEKKVSEKNYNSLKLEVFCQQLF